MTDAPFTWFTPLNDPQEFSVSTPTPVAVSPTLSIVTDKAVYNVGDAIEVTATYSDDSTSPVVLTVNASAQDASGVTVTASASVTVNTTEQQPMSVGVSDSFGDTYSVVSNAAGTAVLSSVIGSPPVPAAA